jgi:hypothetical protein
MKMANVRKGKSIALGHQVPGNVGTDSMSDQVMPFKTFSQG